MSDKIKEIKFDDKARTLTIVFSGNAEDAVIDYSDLESYEIHEDGKRIARGGLHIAKIVTEKKGRGRGFNIMAGSCKSIEIVIFKKDKSTVSVEMLATPVRKNSNDHRMAIDKTMKVANRISEIVDEVEMDRIESVAQGLVDMTKEKELGRHQTMTDYREKLEKGIITEDEFLERKMQVILERGTGATNREND